jgi:type I restriction enzyme, S subunit
MNMSEWKEYRLNEVCHLITDGSHFSPKDESDGLPMFSVKDMRNNGFDYSKVKKISKHDFLVLIKQGCQPEIDDVLIAKDGSVLKHIFRVQGQPDYVVLSSIAILRPKKQLIDPSYLEYVLKNPNTQDYILSNFVSGSGVPRIVLKDFKAVEIIVPSISEQTKIADILKSIDDKIDLLLRQNKTLEELAETLFRQWFVEEAEESWEEKGLDEIADFLNGLACQKFPKKADEIGLPVIKIKELRTGITDASDMATSDVPNKYLVNEGDILFSWSGSLALVLWAGKQGVLNQHLFKVTSSEFPQWFCYFWIKYHLPYFIGVAEDKATTMGHIQRHHLSSVLVVVPPIHKLSEYHQTIEPLFSKLKSNSRQIQTLTQLRENLLPKLMSGEVKVENH